MDREWLIAQLDAGNSIEAIARDVGKHPSTVAYWVNKHALRSPHAGRHAPRGPLSREDLAPLIAGGMSIRDIARELERSPTTVRHWLRHHGLRTAATGRVRRDGGTARELMRDCPRHGWTWFRMVGGKRYRCARCIVSAVSDRRRRVKEILVDEAGGECAACGYRDCIGVLQFQHVDLATKRFHLGRGSRTIARCGSRGGTQMRPALRELPRRGRTRVSHASRNIRQGTLSGVAHTDGPG